MLTLASTTFGSHRNWFRTSLGKLLQLPSAWLASELAGHIGDTKCVSDLQHKGRVVVTRCSREQEQKTEKLEVWRTGRGKRAGVKKVREGVITLRRG